MPSSSASGNCRPEEKTRQCPALAGPVLKDLKAWLENNLTRAPKDSLIGKAIAYTLNQWDLLTGYLADGRLRISNALAENAIRPFAVGRKNGLFADTPRGAKASAIIHSLIETAKANDLEPFAYLRYVLRHIGAVETGNSSRRCCRGGLSHLPQQSRVGADRECHQQMRSVRAGSRKAPLATMPVELCRLWESSVKGWIH